jgi:serine/threonine-protein kinase
MGAVFEAEHTGTERRVALKLLLPSVAAAAGSREKFQLEAKIAARVDSEFIVEVLDAGFDEPSGSLYLAMELLVGQTLAELIKSGGPVSPEQLLPLFAQVAAGLDAAHGYRDAGGVLQPIIHRDLKPENIFLTRRRDGSTVAKILDFGIAKVLSDSTHASQEVRGTPLYMAFEQVTSGALSPQTDIWALGLIAYHGLTGRRYWRAAETPGAGIQSLFGEILSLPLEPPSERIRQLGIAIKLPGAFDPWLLRCLDREPRRRFPSAGAAIAELREIFDCTPQTTDKGGLGWVGRSATATYSVGLPGRDPFPPSTAASLPGLSSADVRPEPFPRMQPLLAMGIASLALVIGGAVWWFARPGASESPAAAVAKPVSPPATAKISADAPAATHATTSPPPTRPPPAEAEVAPLQSPMSTSLTAPEVAPPVPAPLDEESRRKPLRRGSGAKPGDQSSPKETPFDPLNTAPSAAGPRPAPPATPRPAPAPPKEKPFDPLNTGPEPARAR